MTGEDKMLSASEGKTMNQIYILEESLQRTRVIPSMAPLAYGLIFVLQKRLEERKVIEMKESVSVPIAYKYSLSIQEAAEYYGIGEKRLRCFLSEHWNEPFILEIGSHIRIKRRLFEEYLDQVAMV